MTTLLAALLLSPPLSDTFEEKIPGTLAAFTMVKVPAGEATVDGKKVNVGPFWIGATEVTWDVYDIFAFRLDLTAQEQATGVDAKARPSKPYGAPDRGYGHKGYAALGMASNAANKFCEWLSKKTGKKYRIPTEAEWEHAAHAGHKGDPKPLGDYAWILDNSDDVAHPVATKKPNAWGLYDMIGNTAEWVLAADGTMVVRGGSFTQESPMVGIKAREPYSPKWQEADAHVPKSVWWLSDGYYIGMRVVCDGPQ